MAAKLGRPTDSPKTQSVHVRFDEESATILEAYCRQEGVTKAEAIRRGVKKLESDIKK